MEAAAPAAAPSAPKTGWLIKQSRPSTIRKTWNRRFFVLEWPTLRYYKEEADAAAAGREPKGVLQCDGVTLTDDFPHASERPHVFGVFHQSREPFFLQAATTEEMIGWVNAIRNDDAKVGLIDFDEVKMLGEGAYGSVKLVRHRAKRTLHAMKILNKQEQRKNDAVALTKVERDVLLRVRHPFVVQMAFAFSTQENLYMVMDVSAAAPFASSFEEAQRKRLHSTSTAATSTPTCSSRRASRRRRCGSGRRRSRWPWATSTPSALSSATSSPRTSCSTATATPT